MEIYGDNLQASYCDGAGLSNLVTCVTDECSNPEVSFSGLQEHYCIDDASILLEGNPAGGSFFGAGMLEDLFDPQLAGIGYHQITYSWQDSVSSCIYQEVKQVEVNLYPLLTLSGDSVICNNGLARLHATEGFQSYLWNDEIESDSHTIWWDQPGAVNLQAIDANYCDAFVSRELMLTDLIADPVDLGPDTTILEGETITFSPNMPFSNYLWSTGDTSSSITVTNPGTYSLTVTCINGCFARGSVNLATEAATNNAEDKGSMEPSLFPNPFEDSFFLHTDLPGSYSIWTANGVLLAQGLLDSGVQTLSPQLPLAGVYILLIEQGDGNRHYRRIIYHKSH